MIGAQCVGDIAMSHGLTISLFLAGLVGGATHCVAMCSPFVLAQINGRQEIRKLSSLLLLPYHFGRMTTYVLLAVMISSVINLAFLFSDLKPLIAAPMLVVAGVIFLVSAFPKLFVLFPWAVNIRVGLGYGIISRLYGRLVNNASIFGRYGLGVLLGFMPCGLVVSALMAAATAPNILMSAMAMSAFAVGTFPALILVAVGGNSIGYKYPKAVGLMSKGAMMVSSIWLFILAGTMVL